MGNIGLLVDCLIEVRLVIDRDSQVQLGKYNDNN